MADVKLFLSCVSDEFGDYRDELRRALTRPNVEIKIQEDFQAMGGDTLALLETYVESCDVVIHFVGDMAGSTPKPSSVDDLLRRRPELAARRAEGVSPACNTFARFRCVQLFMSCSRPPDRVWACRLARIIGPRDPCGREPEGAGMISIRRNLDSVGARLALRLQMRAARVGRSFR
jgi:Domain of unknown function (DUF4062)